MGVFVTMNPGYAGRSELADNLKQLFRGMAMLKPVRALIGQVMYAQGFLSSEILASKIVLLFQLCKDQLSKQAHYDFGLRALKSVLRSAGNVKRQVQAELESGGSGNLNNESKDDINDETKNDDVEEKKTILIRSLMSTVVPKLVMNDKFLFDSLLDSAFPGANIEGIKEAKLRQAIKEIAEQE